jgi:A/G-specific adenine glycosylase
MIGSARQFQSKLRTWYLKYRRDLPWRVAAGAARAAEFPDPYHVLVSELMLQQTQVSTVIPYFNRFITRFPTVNNLALADEQEVLRLWQGLGYYSRARHLHRAAQAVVDQHDGAIPSDLEQLLSLPGLGRYTAGAVATLAFGRRAPILDGNIVRVLCRLDHVDADPTGSATRQQLWQRAEELLPARNVADFNSALMELGATVCTPRNPQCVLCPVQRHCQAFTTGSQDTIPVKRKSRPTPLVHRWTFCIHRNDHWLIERRPATGRWAGLWQFITIAPADSITIPQQRHAAAASGVTTGKLRKLGRIRHALTHRRYTFDAFVCDAPAARSSPAVTDGQRVWTKLESLSDYPMSKPQLQIAAMLESCI